MPSKTETAKEAKPKAEPKTPEKAVVEEPIADTEPPQEEPTVEPEEATEGKGDGLSADYLMKGPYDGKVIRKELIMEGEQTRRMEDGALPIGVGIDKGRMCAFFAVSPEVPQSEHKPVIISVVTTGGLWPGDGAFIGNLTDENGKCLHVFVRY